MLYTPSTPPLTDPARLAPRIDAARSDLAADGMVTFPSFLSQDAIDATLAVATPKFAAESFHHSRAHNIYFTDDIADLAPDHPAQQRLTTANRTLCADQLTDTPLATLYHDPDFIAFLAAVMGKGALYPMADPLAAVNVMTYRAGEALNWHFDRSEFTTTLLLQAPDAGGAFEYRPALRTDADPNYDGVADLIQGRDRKVRSATLTPGALNVFKGRNTAHRVTPPIGPRPRTVAVLSYFETPGVMFSAEERRGFYGRA